LSTGRAGGEVLHFNDVGLLAEEYDPHTRRMPGNFPQAFSHAGLIDTALRLAGAGDGIRNETGPSHRG